MANKKEIIFIIESLGLGGAEKSLVTLLQNLDYSKYKVDLLMITEGGIFENEVLKEVSIIRYNIFETTNTFHKTFLRIRYFIARKIKNTLHDAEKFWKIFKNTLPPLTNKYDVAIAYSQGFSTYFTATKIIADKKYAWVNIDYKKAGYNLKFDLPYYKAFNAVITVSQEVKNGLVEELKTLKETLPFEIIKDITDIEILLRQSLEYNCDFDADKINIVTVGRLNEQKGLSIAIEACKQLIHAGYPVQWYIIGEGNERKSLEKLIQKYNLSGSFFLKGSISNPYPYIKACDIYVQTSLFEGLCLTLIEAACLCRPIVTTNFPTAYTIIENEETGIICEMNPEAVSSSVIRLINDQELKEKFISNLAKMDNNAKQKSLAKVEALLQGNLIEISI